jgi:hypothetical protein
MSAFLLLATTVCLIASAMLIVASFRLRSAVAFVLGAYVVAWSELVALITVLSAPHLVTRTAVTAGVGVLLLGSVAVWVVTRRPSPPSPRPALQALAQALRDPVLAILALVVTLSFLYLVALAFWTPPNSWDAMWYHLARAAFWKQQQAVGYIEPRNVVLNAHPPVAEIGDLYTMVVAADDRFATGVTLTAYVAAALAVFGIARRLLLDTRAALFGALVFATLPVIVLQASGGLVDLVVASFLAACVYFFLGERSAELALAASALALALGTKLTAVMSIPILVLVALLASSRWRTRTLVLSGAAAATLGSAWSVLNFIKTGAIDGHLDQWFHQRAAHAIAPMAAVASRVLIDFAEAPGAAGWWALGYVFAASAAAAFALWERPHARWPAALAGFVALMPLALLVSEPIAKRGYQWVFFHLGRPDLGQFDQSRGVTGASEFASYFGPLGLLLLASVVVVPIAVARRYLPRVAVVFSAAPLLFAVVLAVSVTYEPWWGRFFAFPVALASAAAGLVLRVRPVAWAVLAIAATTVVLTVRANDEKPPSVWGKPRWWVETRVGPGSGERDVIRFADESIPSHARVGLAISWRDWSYPFFGEQLKRTVRFVPSPSSAEGDLDWLVVAPAMSAPSSRWIRVLRTDDGWRVFRSSMSG